MESQSFQLKYVTGIKVLPPNNDVAFKKDLGDTSRLYSVNFRQHKKSRRQIYCGRKTLIKRFDHRTPSVKYILLYIHQIKKRLSSELLHCALLHTQTATHHGCNEFVHCCMPRPQSIVSHIASMANTRMSLYHSRYLPCYLKIRYIHGALRSGYATIHNAQCNNSVDNLF